MAKGGTNYLQIAAYILLTLIFVLLIGVVRDCGRLPSAPLEGYSSGDTLDIALIYGPGSYYISGDSLSGINLDVALEFSRHTGTPVKFWPVTDPASGIDKLETGAFDILASLPLDNYIKSRFPVSESIFLDRLVLIQLQDSTSQDELITSSLQLNGKKVNVPAGSSAINRLTNLAKEIGGEIEIIETPELSDELLCIQVASGQIPLAVVNERVAQKIAESYPGVKFDSTVSFTQFQVWIFNPKDTVEAERFNGWFDEFKVTSRYRNIINKY